MADLTDVQRDLIDARIRKRSWYPTSDYMSVLEAATRHLAPDDADEFVTGIGWFCVEDGLNSLYRAFFALSSPAFTIRLSSLFWFQFYKGSRLRVTGKGRKWVSAAVTAPYCSRALCHTIKGGMMCALTHAGAKELQVDQHACRSTGNPRCDYHFSWR